MIVKVENYIVRVVESLNQLDCKVILFTILFLNYFTFALSSNEETYLQLAKQFVDPNWIPNSTILNEFAGNRIIFQIFVGYLLKFLSFEWVTALGRLLLCVIFVFPLSRLFKLFDLKNIEVLFLLQILFFPHQSLFAQEWIFLGFETKVFAYFFILYAIYFLIKGQQGKSLLFVGLSSYFHILVGGWFFVVWFIYGLFYSELKVKRLLLLSVLYFLAISPFIFYLSEKLLNNGDNVVGGVSINWIYCFFRSPHHTGIFKSMVYFLKVHAKGVFTTITIGAICWLVLSKKSLSNEYRNMNRLNIVIILITLVNLIVAFFDNNGIFVKYYPFRINALTAFIFSIQLTCFLKDNLTKKVESVNLIYSFIAILLLFNVGYSTLYNIGNTKHYINRIKSIDKLTHYIQTNTQENDILMYLGEKITDDNLPLIRESKRDWFVVYKFIPAGTNKIYNWYQRILEKKLVIDNIEHIFELRNRFKLDYIVSEKKIKHKGLQLIYNDNNYYLYNLLAV